MSATHRTRTMPLPELIEVTQDPLVSAAAFMEVMALGRNEQETLALLRAAKRIKKLAASLGRLAEQRESGT
jgi:hypothetical protein